MSTVSVYVGLDYHDETIRVCVLAKDGKMPFNRDVSNDVLAVGRGIRGMEDSDPRGIFTNFRFHDLTRNRLS